jgi:hypothetical protein
MQLKAVTAPIFAGKGLFVKRKKGETSDKSRDVDRNRMRFCSARCPLNP